MSRRVHRGFTLIELLLALALVSMVTVVLYSTLWFGFKSREGSMKSLATIQKALDAFTLMQQDFDGALPPTGTLAGVFTGTASPYGSSGAADSGATGSGASTGSAMGANSSGLSTSNSSLNGTTAGVHADSPDPNAAVVLSFYTSANTPRLGELGGDIRKVELSVETPVGSTKLALVRRIYYNLLPSKSSEPLVQILCRNVRSFYMRYYDGTLWRDDWDSQAQGDILPNAVEVTLELDAEDAKPGDDSAYKITRVFQLMVGVSAANAGAGGTQ